MWVNLIYDFIPMQIHQNQLKEFWEICFGEFLVQK